MTWWSGRTLRSSDPGGKRGLYGLCKTGNLRVLDCGVGVRTRRYRRLWQRRGKLRLLASFRQSSWWLFQRVGLVAGKCYSCEETQSAHSESARARLLRVRS